MRITRSRLQSSAARFWGDMGFTWDIKVKGFGPFAHVAGGRLSLEDSRVAVYSGNGQGKTCISRLFRAAEPGSGKLPEHVLTHGCNSGSFSFTIIQQDSDDKALAITLKAGETPSISNGTGCIFHVFNSDYVRDNLVASHYSPSDENFTGYIVGKENIDVSAKRKRLNELLQQGQEKRSSIEQAVDKARGELSDLKLTRVRNYRELTVDNVLSLDVESHDYDAKLSELKALSNLPDDVPMLAGLSFSAGGVDLDSISKLLKTEYSRDQFTEDFIEEVSPKRSFIESGLDLLEDDVCPFCGTRFNDEARALIKSYEAYVQGQEAKVAAAIEGYSTNLKLLMTSYEAFIVIYQDRQNWLASLKPAFPALSKDGLPAIPKPGDFDAVVNSIIELLNEKASDISTVQDCGAVETLREMLFRVSTAVSSANITLSTLDRSVSNSTRALTTVKQSVCAEMTKKVRLDCDALIKERVAILEDYKKLREEIKADEDRSRRSKRDTIAETLETLIHMVFGSKYTFDPEQFTVKLDGITLGSETDGVMSDGEKSVLAFCHYIASTWSLLDLVEDSAKLFFVIDDPISSMDFHYVYSVTQIIRSLKATFSLSPVRLLLMTHNTAFFNLLARNGIVKRCYTLHDGVIELCKSGYLAPYGEHLKDLYKVACGESQPTHTTGNSIRQIIETLWRFDNPAVRKLSDYLETPECSDLRDCEYIYTICQDLSHGATPFDREQPPDEDSVKRACGAVISHIHSKYPGQLVAHNIDYDPERLPDL